MKRMNIKKRCHKCIQMERDWKAHKINPSLRISIQVFYNSQKDGTGLEMGCNPKCPFLTKSIKVLG